MSAPRFVLFVHGYSETSLGAYYSFPAILKEAMGDAVAHVALAAFDSLDDSVSISDLAKTMDARVAELETQGWKTSQCAVICHSTGALVARRWILDRLSAHLELPSHLITMAGANHGSTLARMGKSVLGYLQKIIQKHILTVGAQVLTDLEYGSGFLLRLNAEWLDAWNSGSLSSLFAFSMGGDSVGKDPTLRLFWETHEPGSDNTVRISGANLNYRIIKATHSGTSVDVEAVVPAMRFPHLVLQDYSHFGPDTGILGNVKGPADAPMAAVLQALGVADEDGYAGVERDWSGRSATWIQGHAETANSTAVFTLSDRSGRYIDDCMIAILDQRQLGAASNSTSEAAAASRAAAMNSVSPCVLPHSPIQNDTLLGSYSFYLNYGQYIQSSPHWFHIEVNSAGEQATRYRYKPLTFTQPPSLQHTIAPNEVTYVSLTLERESDQSYSVYEPGPEVDLASIAWLPPFPFPDTGRIAPRPV